MKKFTISDQDLNALFIEEKTFRHAKYIMDNCKKSKFGYGNDAYQNNHIFYYLECDEKFVKSLYEAICSDGMRQDVSIYLILDLHKKLKSKEEKEEEIF